jgi:hypothetical protein
MKKLLILLFLSISMIGYTQKPLNIGVTYTPGRTGAGIVLNKDKVFIGYESGKYSFNHRLYGYEQIKLHKITCHYVVDTYEENPEIKSNILLGIGYNNFYNYIGNHYMINPNKLSKFSLEFGGNIDFGLTNVLLLFDFINWEGKIGILIEI